MRYVGPITGCYTLSDRHEANGKGIAVHACRTLSISSTAAAISAVQVGEVGEWITARFDGIGIIRGKIDRMIDGGFVFQISGTPVQQLKLAKRIDWLKRKSQRASTDKREYPRSQPRDARSTITLANDEVKPCYLIDVSRSGAAVSMNYRPEVGTALVLGIVACKVIRHIDEGFVVKFDALQDADAVEQLVTGFEPRLREEASAAAAG
ncbi:MAG TPA: PilZ domain-containing protein [Devosia sp.]|nr:PilZ domain-containing protein [Devosia sp.]